MRFSSSKIAEITRKLLTIILVFSFFGCVSSKSITESDKASIQSVSVSEDVFIPDRMFYQGPKESILMGTRGMLGFMQAGESALDAEQAFKLAMNAYDIDIAKIVRNEFTSKLAHSNIFKVNDDGNSLYKFKLMIKVYGFAQYQGLSQQLKPMLGIEARLEGSDNKVLWKKYAFITALNGSTPSHTSIEYLKNPDFILEAFNTASRIVIAELIDDLRIK
jgi:hypothetical protein